MVRKAFTAETSAFVVAPDPRWHPGVCAMTAIGLAAISWIPILAVWAALGG